MPDNVKRSQNFMSFNEAAKQPTCPFTANRLRTMQKRGELPGIWSGSRFLVNYPLLMQQLEDLSRKAVRAGEGTTKMAQTREKLTLSVAEAAQLLGLSTPKVYELTHRADFPAFRIGNRTLVSRRLLEKWVDREAGGDGAYEQ